ncbi:MAG: hypothetical protein JNK87_24435 [Bryobacterales bacterium]|nr:hypothetical protein [Bryobacterales bacterium]
MRLSPVAYLVFLAVPLFAFCIARLAARAGYSAPAILLFGLAALVPPINLALLLWLASAPWPRDFRRPNSL